MPNDANVVGNEYLEQKEREINSELGQARIPPIYSEGRCHLSCLVRSCSHIRGGWDMFFYLLHNEANFWKIQANVSHQIDRLYIIKKIYEVYFCHHGISKDFYKTYQEQGKGWRWDFPDFTAMPQNEECKLAEEDFGRPSKRYRKELQEMEFRMHRVPRIFEICDYFLRITKYGFVPSCNTKFMTHCCCFVRSPEERLIGRIFGREVKDMPIFHIAMDPSEKGRKVYKKVVKEVGENFFYNRYPRFFEPDLSNKNGHAFISEGERKMAYLFRKYTLCIEKRGFNEFQQDTKVVNIP